MVESFAREAIENWVGDFCAGDELRAFAAKVRDAAHEILVRFHVAACDANSLAAGEIEEGDCRTALLGELARLSLDERTKNSVPDLVASYLGELERQGRLADGRRLGAFVRALKPAWLAAGGETKPFVRAGTPVGRNDPCPCGSGQKYKKCCMNRLG